LDWTRCDPVTRRLDERRESSLAHSTEPQRHCLWTQSCSHLLRTTKPTSRISLRQSLDMTQCGPAPPVTQIPPIPGALSSKPDVGLSIIGHQAR
jgi:hypothetical protein